ncbi:MAG: PEGA domain-containing protein [Methanoculleus sp.]|nr:PEGA domain-containing protein [Methanoculleus sp.]
MVSAHTQGSSRRLIILSLCLLLALAAPATASPTTELRIAKIAADGVTVIDEKTVDYRWLERNLPVQGDGVTHYYHQGPVFKLAWEKKHPDEPYNFWNPEEDINAFDENENQNLDKDMGAVKGTDLKYICELVGGMGKEGTVRVRAVDGMSKTFPYRNVYEPESRQGPMVVTWYRAEDGYVPDYYTGMRLVFFADTSTNPYGNHTFGIWDMHECFDEEYWYFFQPDLPTTTGLSVKYVSEIIIYSDEEPTGSIYVNSTPSGATVYIDDEKAEGVTPCTLSGIETGSRAIRVELEGFVRPDEKWVTVAANTIAEVEFNLTPETGSIAISSVPTNASIYLDGNATEFRTDITLDAIPIGKHTVELVMPGYRNATRTIVVEKGECSIVDVVISLANSTAGGSSSGNGSIAVSSVPTNASIYFDGNATGLRTDTTLDGVPVGEHTVELALPGYRNATRTVVVEEDECSIIDLALSPTEGEPGDSAGDEPHSTGANVSAGHDGPVAGHPAPKNPLEAFITGILNFLSGIFFFFGTEEDLPGTPELNSTPAPGEDIGTPIPTGTPALPAAMPGDDLVAKSRSGGLYIESHPPGMTIVVDNKRLVWRTPHAVYGLREGLHSISVEESDPDRSGEDTGFRFEAVQAWVYPDALTPVIVDGLTTAHEKTIRVDSKAYGGEKFTVNGVFPGGTIPGDAETEGVKPWITISRNGTYLSHGIPYSIVAGETFRVEPREGGTVPINIDSNPRGAAVFVDGFPTGGETPYRVEGLSPGQHRILVSKPGYIPAGDVITIPEGAETGGTVTCTLREYTHGDLLVESTIPDGKIYLYGRYTGEKTPHTFSGMSIGTYEVRVVSEDDAKTVEDVLVKPGETTGCKVTLEG